MRAPINIPQVPGSLQSQYQTPYGRIDYDFTPSWTWKGDYNCYGYLAKHTHGVAPMKKHFVYFGFASLLALTMTASSPAQNSGAEIYQSKCQMCHGADGSGNTPAGKAMKTHPFNAPDVLKESDADLIAVIKKGKNKMPAFEGKLTDAQIATLITHIHTLQK